MEEEFKFCPSDDETESRPTHLEAFRYVLQIGKHKGKCLGVILRTKDGRSYLRYLLTWNKLYDKTRLYIEVALEGYETKIGRR